MNKVGLRLSVRFLVIYQALVEAFRLQVIRLLVKASDELEDISYGIDEMIEEKVFRTIDEDLWLLEITLDDEEV